MIATHIKKTKDNMLGVTGVIVWDITNTFSPVLHLNVSHLSICSWFFWGDGDGVFKKYFLSQLNLIQRSFMKNYGLDQNQWIFFFQTKYKTFFFLN